MWTRATCHPVLEVACFGGVQTARLSAGSFNAQPQAPACGRRGPLGGPVCAAPAGGVKRVAPPTRPPYDHAQHKLSRTDALRSPSWSRLHRPGKGTYDGTRQSALALASPCLPPRSLPSRQPATPGRQQSPAGVTYPDIGLDFIVPPASRTPRPIWLRIRRRRDDSGATALRFTNGPCPIGPPAFSLLAPRQNPGEAHVGVQESGQRLEWPTGLGGQGVEGCRHLGEWKGLEVKVPTQRPAGEPSATHRGVARPAALRCTHRTVPPLGSDQLLASIRNHPLVKITPIGQTVQGRPLEIVHIGTAQAPYRVFLRASSASLGVGRQLGPCRASSSDCSRTMTTRRSFSARLQRGHPADGEQGRRGPRDDTFQSARQRSQSQLGSTGRSQVSPENAVLERGLPRDCCCRRPHLAIELHNDGGGNLHISRPAVPQ